MSTKPKPGEVELSLEKVHEFYCGARSILHEIYKGAAGPGSVKVTIAMEGIVAILTLQQELFVAVGEKFDKATLYEAAKAYQAWRAELDRAAESCTPTPPVARTDLN